MMESEKAEAQGVQGQAGLDGHGEDGVGIASGRDGTGAGRGGVICLAKLDPDAILDEPALAGALGVCVRTLRRMVVRHELPPPFKAAGRSRWFAGKVLDHFKQAAERKEKEAERAAAKIRSISP